MEELFLLHFDIFCYDAKFSNTHKISVKALFVSTIGCQETNIIIDKNNGLRFTK